MMMINLKVLVLVLLHWITKKLKNRLENASSISFNYFLTYILLHFFFVRIF